MEDKFTIRVNVVDRYYPIKIERKDEEMLRKAAKMINDAVLQYKQMYSDKDSQDFLAMASLHFVVKYMNSSEEELKTLSLIEDIRDLEKELADYLEKEL